MTLEQPGTATTTDPEPTLLAERLAAVRSSGWGAPVRLVQPRNPAFWVYLVITGWGLLHSGALPGVADPGVRAGDHRGGSVVRPVRGPLWWFTQHIDRYAHQSRRMAVLAAVWAASAPP